MFASTDSPSNRQIVVRISDIDLRIYRVRFRNRGAAGLDAIDAAWMSRAIAMPTETSLRAVAEAVLRADLVEASGQSGSTDDHARDTKEPLLELWTGGPAGRAFVRPVSVTVTVLRLRFDSRARVVVMDPVGHLHLTRHQAAKDE
jgi:hypothetical protein